jgi:hypothetical protein
VVTLNYLRYGVFFTALAAKRCFDVVFLLWMENTVSRSTFLFLKYRFKGYCRNIAGTEYGYNKIRQIAGREAWCFPYCGLTFYLFGTEI